MMRMTDKRLPCTSDMARVVAVAVSDWQNRVRSALVHVRAETNVPHDAATCTQIPCKSCVTLLPVQAS